MKITDCSVRLDGGLTCTDDGGGFLGALYAYSESDIRIEGCRSQVDVLSTEEYNSGHLGGFAGRCANTQLFRCGATGSVRGSRYVGGFAGKLAHASMRECFATGAVDANRANNGALLGELSDESVVEDCYAWGSLASPESDAGGLIGTLDGRDSYVPVRRCYYQGTLSGGEDTGGICGRCEEDPTTEIEDCLVLSPSISGGTPTGRIVSDTPSNFTLRGNYATTLQVLQDGQPKPIADNPNGADGGTITAAQITAVMRASGWSDTVWDYGSVTADSGPRLLFIEDSLAVTVPS